MSKLLQEKFEQAIWVGKSLFDRKNATGSSANMSFLHDDMIYITGSGTCFGNLKPEDFSLVSFEGTYISGKNPSKELPLHQIVYQKSNEINAVLHTHSFYATLWSCLHHENEADCMPSYTPYLRMKVGAIGLIPYAKPGSDELFHHMKKRVDKSSGYLLKQHGPVIGDKDILSAFYGLEELEESAKIAWHLRGEGLKLIN